MRREKLEIIFAKIVIEVWFFADLDKLLRNHANKLGVR